MRGWWDSGGLLYARSASGLTRASRERTVTSGWWAQEGKPTTVKLSNRGVEKLEVDALATVGCAANQ
jgi:hypothetical protein